MLSPQTPQQSGKLSWRAKARLRAGLPLRTRGGQPNSNRLRHGRYSGYYLHRRAATQVLVRSTNALIARIKLATKLGLYPPRPVTSPSNLTSAPTRTSPLWGGRKIAERSETNFRVGVGHAHRPPPGMLRIPTSPQGGGEKQPHPAKNPQDVATRVALRLRAWGNAA